MEKPTNTLDNASPQVPQDSLGTILLMFAWPAVWYTLLIYVVGPFFFTPSGGVPTWYFLTVVALGGGAELVVGLALLRREGYPLTLSALRERLRWRWPKGWKIWGVAVVIFILGMSLSMAMGPVNRALASVPGFVPPAWWPAASNPKAQVNSAADVFPDVNLKGNWGIFFAYLIIGLVSNILGEEIYYRGYLLPRMRGVFGKWDWVANGVLFTLKHVYQRWLYPGILAGGVFFALAAGPMGSLPLAMAYHWLGNFLLPLILLLMAVLGLG